MRPRYLLNFDFISGFQNHSVDEDILPELNEMVTSPKQNVKIYLSSPSFYIVSFGCVGSLAAEMVSGY